MAFPITENKVQHCVLIWQWWHGLGVHGKSFLVQLLISTGNRFSLNT